MGKGEMTNLVEEPVAVGQEMGGVALGDPALVDGGQPRLVEDGGGHHPAEEAASLRLLFGCWGHLHLGEQLGGV